MPCATQEDSASVPADRASAKADFLHKKCGALRIKISLSFSWDIEILQLPVKFQTTIDLTYKESWPSELGNYFVCKRFAVHNLLWSLEFVIQRNLEHDTIAAMVLLYNKYKEFQWYH